MLAPAYVMRITRSVSYQVYCAAVWRSVNFFLYFEGKIQKREKKHSCGWFAHVGSVVKGVRAVGVAPPEAVPFAVLVVSRQVVLREISRTLRVISFDSWAA